MRRGGRHAFVYVFVGLLIFTSACNTDAKDEHLTTEEAIIAKTIKQAESVDSYIVEGGIRDEIIWEDGRSEYNLLLLSGSMIKSLERSHTQITEKYGFEETESTITSGELYRSKRDIFVKSDEGWRKEKESDSYEFNETDYEAAILFLDRLENIEEIKVKEDEDEYELSYFGPDASLYEIYEPVTSETADGITFVETERPEVFLRIDKEDYTVLEFTTKFFYEDEAGSDSNSVLTVELRFDDINEIEDITIPTEVIKEAEQNE